VPVPVFNEHGEEIASRTRYDNRLLAFLLRRLRADRYGGDLRARPPPDAADRAPPPLALSLRALEPALPAPPEQLLGEELPHELEIADLADGKLPDWLQEQRIAPDMTDPRSKREQRFFNDYLETVKHQHPKPPYTNPPRKAGGRARGKRVQV
jgi:hypothetical protein